MPLSKLCRNLPDVHHCWKVWRDAHCTTCILSPTKKVFCIAKKAMYKRGCYFTHFFTQQPNEILKSAFFCFAMAKLAYIGIGLCVKWRRNNVTPLHLITFLHTRMTTGNSENTNLGGNLKLTRRTLFVEVQYLNNTFATKAKEIKSWSKKPFWLMSLVEKRKGAYFRSK